MVGETINVTCAIGALSNGTRPLFPAPTDANGGGLTIIGAHAVMGGSADSSLVLVKGTLSGGTFTANGTISSAAVGGTAAPFAANIVKTWTIGTTKFVDASEWIAVVEGNVAACNAVTVITIQYQVGK